MDPNATTWLPHDQENASVSHSYYFYKTEQLAFLWIMLAMIVFGNSAVLLALALSKSKKSRMNYFITHLAIADLCVGMVSVLTDIIWKMTVSWLAGNVACKLIRYLQVLVTYSSTYVLVALSIDRYDAITHPMKFSGSWRRAHLLVIVAWALSAMFSAPILLLYKEAIIEGQPQCWIDLGAQWKWQLYMTLVAVALFLLPTLIISACYTIIVITIWSKGKTLNPLLTGSVTHVQKNKRRAGQRGEDGIRKVDRGDVDSKRASSRGLIPKAKIKTVKMTFVIVFVFILCWSPYIVYDLLQVYGHIPINQTQNAVSTFIQSLAPLNSAANPLIYCLFSTHICRNLRKISALNWMAEHFCCCFPTLRRPFQHGAIYRDNTITSESVSRSSRRSSSSVLARTSIAPRTRSSTLERHVTLNSDL